MGVGNAGWGRIQWGWVADGDRASRDGGGDGDRHNGDAVRMGKEPMGTDGDNLMPPYTCLICDRAVRF